MKPNPYKPPAGDVALLDWQEPATRQSLSEAIQAFLASEISAFQFDERLEAFRGSDDPVIQHVAEALWYHYDDCDDHFVCLTKEEWDYFQRLLLVLASDCRIEEQSERRWSLRQLIAALTLLAFVCCALMAGWGHHLFLIAMPFGIISVALSSWRQSAETPASPYHEIIFPFATFADLAAAYRGSSFRKTRYPKPIAGRRIHSPIMSAFWHLQAYTIWLMVAPVPLFFQAFPETHTLAQVRAV